MKTILFISLLSLVAFADTYQYELSGMHCGSCKKAISSTVCKVPGIKTCEVNVGSMTLTAAEGQKIDQEAVKKAVQEAAEKFKSEYAIASTKEITPAAKPNEETKGLKKTESSKKD